MNRTAKSLMIFVAAIVASVAVYLWWWTYTPIRVVDAGEVAGLAIGQSKSEVLSPTSIDTRSFSPVPKPEGMRVWWNPQDIGPAEKAVFMAASEWRLGETAQELCPESKPCSLARAFFSGDHLERVEVTCTPCK